MLRWSVSALQSGVWPDSDYMGRAWRDLEGQEDRAARAGSPLAGGFFAVFWEAVGDWEWLSQTFGLDRWKVSYNCAEICFRCPACIEGHGRHNFKLLDIDAEMFDDELARGRWRICSRPLFHGRSSLSSTASSCRIQSFGPGCTARRSACITKCSSCTARRQRAP